MLPALKNRNSTVLSYRTPLDFYLSKHIHLYVVHIYNTLYATGIDLANGDANDKQWLEDKHISL